MSIVKMLGENQHPDMFPSSPFKQDCCNPSLHLFPQLNLLLVMFDDWEIIGE